MSAPSFVSHSSVNWLWLWLGQTNASQGKPRERNTHITTDFRISRGTFNLISFTCDRCSWGGRNPTSRLTGAAGRTRNADASSASTIFTLNQIALHLVFANQRGHPSLQCLPVTQVTPRQLPAQLRRVLGQRLAEPFSRSVPVAYRLVGVRSVVALQI